MIGGPPALRAGARPAAPATLEDERGAWRRLAAIASAPYRRAGPYAWRHARGKLAHDPAFAHLVRAGLLAPRARVLDLGCGQGLLTSVVRAAAQLSREGRWPRGWPAPPLDVRVTGIERLARDVARARIAMRGEAAFVCGDMRATAFPACDAIVVLDALQYIDHAEQDDVLARSHAALRGGGTLVLRVGDASRRLRFAWSRAVDRLLMGLRGGGWQPIRGRALDQWLHQLRTTGFDAVDVTPLGRGGFANMLLVARVDPRPATATPPRA